VGENMVTSQLHRRNWCRRWFVLDVEAGELVYYKDATLAQYKGTVRILATSSIHIPDAVRLRGRHRPGKNESLHYFELRGVRDDRGRLRHRPFALRTSTPRELIEWIRSLRTCLRLLRRDLSCRPLATTGAIATIDLGANERRHSLDDGDGQEKDREEEEPEEPSDQESSDSSSSSDKVQELEDVPSPPALLPLSAGAGGARRVDELEKVLSFRKRLDEDKTQETAAEEEAEAAEEAEEEAADEASTVVVVEEQANDECPERPSAGDATTEETPAAGRPIEASVGRRSSEGDANGTQRPALERRRSSSPNTPLRRPLRRPPPPKRPAPPPPPAQQSLRSPLTEGDLALRDLALACASSDADAVAVSIARAVHECGVKTDHPAIRRARALLAMLDQPPAERDARRAELERALDDANDTAALGNAIRDAIAFGLDENSHHVLNAQARLVHLLVGLEENNTNSPTHEKKNNNNTRPAPPSSRNVGDLARRGSPVPEPCTSP